MDPVRFEAFTATAAPCQNTENTENAGGHKQKLYVGTMAKFILLGMDQLLGYIRGFDKTCLMQELCSAMRDYVKHWEREETAVVGVSSVGKTIVAVILQ